MGFRVISIFLLWTIASGLEINCFAAEAITIVNDLDGRVFFESEWDHARNWPIEGVLDKVGTRIKELPNEPLEKVVAVTFDGGDFMNGEYLYGYPTDPPLKNEQLQVLHSFPNLRWLSLQHTGVTNACLPTLQPLKKLSVLILRETAIDDAAVPQLAELKNLAVIDVRASKISAVGAETLQRKLPNSMILHDSNPRRAIIYQELASLPNPAVKWSVTKDQRLVFRAFIDKHQYIEGEPIVVTAEIRNVSDQVIPLVSPSRPNSPTGFLLAQLRSEYVLVPCETDERGGSLVQLLPQHTHSLSFSLGKHERLPSLTDFILPMLGQVSSLPAAEYKLQLGFSGKNLVAKDADSRKLLLERLEAQDVWLGQMAFSEIGFSVLPPLEGNRIADLTCEIRVEPENLLAEQQMRVTRIIRNHSNEPRKIYGFHFLNGDLIFHFVNLETAERSRQPFEACGVHAPREIKAGEVLKETLEYSFTPISGKYRFYILCRVPDTATPLVSNSLMLDLLVNPATAVKEAFIRRGIQVRVDRADPEQQWIMEATFEGTNWRDEDVEILRKAPRLSTLNLAVPGITDESLEVIAELRELVWLRLSDSRVTDAGLERLAGLRSLKQLHLDGCAGVKGNGLRALLGLESLRDLRLNGTSVNDEGLRIVGQMSGLESLTLDKTAVTNEGVGHLAKLKNLKSISFFGTQVTSEAMDHLSQLTELRSLSLAATSVDDRAIDGLQKLENLEHLYLHRTGITFAGMMRLTALTNLAHLTLSHSNFTPAEIQTLTDSLPIGN